ncbi:YfjI family protein [Vibrio sp. 10N.261.51.F12]|uniref:YfjI family protein n=1 Tax=Vibrio sp. 10N.261.51.F12 TaxID=3229679 RepID=UPI00354F3ADB
MMNFELVERLYNAIQPKKTAPQQESAVITKGSTACSNKQDAKNGTVASNGVNDSNVAVSYPPKHVVNHAEISSTPPVLLPAAELQATSYEWQQPKPLTTEMIAVPPFDIDLLPSSMQKFATREAQRMDNAPVDYIAISLLVCIGALVGQSVEIQPKEFDTGWKVSPILWGMVIGTPSMKKTPSMEAAMAFLHDVQQKIIDPMNIASAEYAEVKRELVESQKNEMKSELKSLLSEGREQEARELSDKIANTDEPQALVRALIANDTTIEALLIKLVGNPNGLLLFRDELVGWLKELAKNGREHERAMYLQAFNASKSPYVVERVGRENIVIPSLAVSILGGIQPSRLSEVLQDRNSGKGNDGLFERFQLAVFPESNQGSYTDVAPDHEHKEVVSSIFMKLANVEHNETETCRFNSDAQLLWGSWSEEFATKIRDMDESWQAIKGKHPALVAKLSLIFHLIEEAENCADIKSSDSKRIRVHNLERAIKWLEYLDAHMQKIIQIGKHSSQKKNSSPARSLLERLDKFDGSFTKQQLAQKGWSNLTAKNSREEALDELESKGYIRWVESPRKQFEIHPEFR